MIAPKNPYLIFDSEVVAEAMDDFTKMLDDKRRMAITKITEDKLDKVSPRDLAYIGDVLTKNHQLLSGGATENVKVSGVEISVRKND